jgi:hypothetical protein
MPAAERSWIPLALLGATLLAICFVLETSGEIAGSARDAVLAARNVELATSMRSDSRVATKPWNAQLGIARRAQTLKTLFYAHASFDTILSLFQQQQALCGRETTDVQVLCFSGNAIATWRRGPPGAFAYLPR